MTTLRYPDFKISSKHLAVRKKEKIKLKCCDRIVGNLIDLIKSFPPSIVFAKIGVATAPDESKKLV